MRVRLCRYGLAMELVFISEAALVTQGPHLAIDPPAVVAPHHATSYSNYPSDPCCRPRPYYPHKVRVLKTSAGWGGLGQRECYWRAALPFLEGTCVAHALRCV